MGSHSIVLNKPFCEIDIECLGIGSVVSELKKLFLQCPVEPFILWIVFRCLGTAPPVGKLKLLQPFLEMLVKLTPVVGMDVDDVAIEKKV